MSCAVSAFIAVVYVDSGVAVLALRFPWILRNLFLCSGLR